MPDLTKKCRVWYEATLRESSYNLSPPNLLETHHVRGIRPRSAVELEPRDPGAGIFQVDGVAITQYVELHGMIGHQTKVRRREDTT